MRMKEGLELWTEPIMEENLSLGKMAMFVEILKKIKNWWKLLFIKLLWLFLFSPGYEGEYICYSLTEYVFFLWKYKL